LTSQDVIIIGAGPCGLSCAASFAAAGFSATILEKGCLVNSIYRFPDEMRFFSSPEGLQIGKLPMSCASGRPTRAEALRYYSEVVREFRLNIRPFTPVERIDGHDGNFRVNEYRAGKVVIATGYYEWPNLLPKVMHYFRDAFPYIGTRVMVIGGGNSAGNVAMALTEAGAEVTLVHRRETFAMKPWLQEAVGRAIADGRIRSFPCSQALQIHSHFVTINSPHGHVEIANDFVFAMTGYHPDVTFLRANRVPGRAGIYLAGAVCGQGVNIENGRSHAERILQELGATSNT
jgi:thioredoxin reductase (NADPH)